MSKLYGIPTLEFAAEMAAPASDFDEQAVRDGFDGISLDEIRDMLESSKRVTEVIGNMLDMKPLLNHGRS